MLTTLRQPVSHILFCEGCCCGRTERGKPELPVGMLKSAWADGKLNRTVQLTISGCLGPCDRTNVSLILTPDEQIWLGDLAGPEVYQVLIDWAKECQAASQFVPLPSILEPHRMHRWNSRERSLEVVA